jgi:hypothetical protein
MTRVQLMGSAVLGTVLLASVPGFTTAQEELDGSWWQVPAAPTGYTDAIAAWTGEEMLIVPTRGRVPLLSFDPLTSRWRTLTSAPHRIDPDTPAVWIGRDLLLLADQVGEDGPLRFRAGNDRWRDVQPYPSPIHRIAAALWTGDRVIAASEDYGAVVEYDPRRNSWRALPKIPDAEVVRGLHWTASVASNAWARRAPSMGPSRYRFGPSS